MTTLIVFLPNEADIGFKLNPGFVPGFFFCTEPISVMQGKDIPSTQRYLQVGVD